MHTNTYTFISRTCETHHFYLHAVRIGGTIYLQHAYYVHTDLDVIRHYTSYTFAVTCCTPHLMSPWSVLRLIQCHTCRLHASYNATPAGVKPLLRLLLSVMRLWTLYAAFQYASYTAALISGTPRIRLHCRLHTSYNLVLACYARLNWLRWLVLRLDYSCVIRCDTSNTVALTNDAPLKLLRWPTIRLDYSCIDRICASDKLTMSSAAHAITLCLHSIVHAYASQRGVSYTLAFTGHDPHTHLCWPAEIFV